MNVFAIVLVHQALDAEPRFAYHNIMLKIPRVALFQPEGGSKDRILELFRRHEYSLRIVMSALDVIALMDEEAAPFDAIVVPMQLQDGSSCLATCLAVKSRDRLTAIPLVALGDTADRVVIQSLYGAGADTVAPSPLDAEWIYHQISAMARLRRELDERLVSKVTASGLMHPVVGAFHSLRQGILVFDTRFSLAFTNRAAAVMLALRPGDDKSKLARQFMPYLKEHQNAAQLSLAEGATALGTSTFQAALERQSGQHFDAELSVTSLVRDPNIVVGYSAALTDMSELDHLANSLLQAQRTRTVALLGLASCVRFLELMLENRILSPMQYLRDFIAEAPLDCQIESALTALMDALDLVINPEVNVRVKVDHNCRLAVSAPDFMQLTGLLLLHAVDHAGISGEVLVYATRQQNGGLSLTFTAQAHKATPLLEGDLLSDLVHSDFALFNDLPDRDSKATPGLAAADAIAQKYRAAIEFQRLGDAVIKLRVVLPVLS